MSTCAMLPDETPIYGTLIAPQLCAIIYQHFFNVRLDVMVDGLTNSVYGAPSSCKDRSGVLVGMVCLRCNC